MLNDGEIKKKVVLADDHPIYRAGLRQILEEEGGYEIVAEAGNGASCVAILKMLNPEIVILDLAMPEIDGYGVLEWMQVNLPTAVSVILSMHSSQGYATKAKMLGARAFIAKEDAAQELHNALITPPGVFYLSASVGRSNIQIEQPGELNPAIELIETLTPAESNILTMVGQSMTSRQIGEKLNLSHRTVQTHRQHIVQKLELHGSNSLLEFAIRHRDEIDGL